MLLVGHRAVLDAGIMGTQIRAPGHHTTIVLMGFWGGPQVGPHDG